MQLLMESESGHTKDPYVHMLLEEPDFHRGGTRVVYEALQWALMRGTKFKRKTLYFIIIILLFQSNNTM
jgi:hypothetical protein